MEPVHKHLLISGTVKLLPNKMIKEPQMAKFALNVENVVEKWLDDLVNLVKMRIFIPARARYCSTYGNEGVTGIISLETSHASIHFWDQDKSFKFDLYSCQDFDVDTVIKHLNKFDLEKYSYKVIDRDTNEVVGHGGNN